MTDREKFNAWVEACPVTVRRVNLDAHGYVAVQVQIAATWNSNDLQDFVKRYGNDFLTYDDRFEDARHQAQWKIDKQRPADYWTR